MLQNTIHPSLFCLFIGLWLLFGSWVRCIPSQGLEKQQVVKEPEKRGSIISKASKALFPKRKKQIKKEALPPDYGDRTQLSAFLLCLFIGFSGAHHFYMQNYIIGIIQLTSFLIFVFMAFSGVLVFAAFGILIGFGLFAWVLADIFILVFRGLVPKSRRKLIPW